MEHSQSTVTRVPLSTRGLGSAPEQVSCPQWHCYPITATVWPALDTSWPLSHWKLRFTFLTRPLVCGDLKKKKTGVGWCTEGPRPGISLESRPQVKFGLKAKNRFYIFKWLHLKWLHEYSCNILDFAPWSSKPEAFIYWLFHKKICWLLVEAVSSQRVVPGSAASPWSLLEIHILRPHPRFTESETLRVGPSICVLTGPLDDSAAG